MSIPYINSTWAFWAPLIVTVYLSAILLRQAFRNKKGLRSVLVMAALLLLPFFFAAYMVYGVNVFLAFDPNYLPNLHPDNWWVLTVELKNQETMQFNLIATAIAFSLIYIGVTVLVYLGTNFIQKRSDRVFLSIHKGLIKWTIVFIGCWIFLRIRLWPAILGMGAVSIIIGFALKEMLENLFTGMSLEMEGAFHRGDWIRLGNSDTVGQVYEKSWRSTKILTLREESITIPNRLLAAEKIMAYSKPTPMFVHTITVGTSYNDPPVKVKEILRNILMQETLIANKPAPCVRVQDYGDFAINYRMVFWVKDYSMLPRISDSLLTQVWYAFRFNGIEIPFPVRTVHLKQWDEVRREQSVKESEVEDMESVIQGLACFRDRLKLSDIEFIAQNSIMKEYQKDEVIIYRKEMGDAVYFVINGSCHVILPGKKESTLMPGEYFGEMGLLGATHRTANVTAGQDGVTVLRLDKHCMDLLFRTYPELLSEFNQEQKVRQVKLKAETKAEAKHAEGKHKDNAIKKMMEGTSRFLRPW